MFIIHNANFPIYAAENWYNKKNYATIDKLSMFIYLKWQTKGPLLVSCKQFNKSDKRWHWKYEAFHFPPTINSTRCWSTNLFIYFTFAHPLSQVHFSSFQAWLIFHVYIVGIVLLKLWVKPVAPGNVSTLIYFNLVDGNKLGVKLEQFFKQL